jgi:hypothetical protein
MSLALGSTPGANQPNDTPAFRETRDEQATLQRVPDNDVAPLRGRVVGVIVDSRERVLKRRDRLFERDPVIPQIRGRLVRIPLECWSRHPRRLLPRERGAGPSAVGPTPSSAARLHRWRRPRPQQLLLGQRSESFQFLDLILREPRAETPPGDDAPGTDSAFEPLLHLEIHRGERPNANQPPHEDDVAQGDPPRPGQRYAVACPSARGRHAQCEGHCHDEPDESHGLTVSRHHGQTASKSRTTRCGPPAGASPSRTQSAVCIPAARAASSSPTTSETNSTSTGVRSSAAAMRR